MKQLKELQDKLEKNQHLLSQVFEEAKTTGDDGKPTYDLSKVKCLGDSKTPSEIAEVIQKMNAEMSELGEQIDTYRGAQSALDSATKGTGMVHPGAGEGEPKEGSKSRKSFGEHVTGHKTFAQWQSGAKQGMIVVPDFGLAEMKTLFQTSAGWAPESTRTGILIDEPTRPIQIIDLIPSGQTGQAQVVYMEETTRTHNAAEIAEGGTYPEDEFVLTEQQEPVRKIGTSIPVTDEQLEDVAAVQSYLNQRIRFGLRQRLDGQILNGDGVAPNLEGILNRSGLQTQAKGTDPVPDAIHKAITKVRVTGRAMPGAVIMHPGDWQDLRLLRTADGMYIWGNPSDQGTARVWGLPIALSDAIAEGTALVGDYANFSQLYERRGVEVSMGYVGTQFTEGKQTMRADMRVALAVYRPAAFCSVTGI